MSDPAWRPVSGGEWCRHLAHERSLPQASGQLPCVLRQRVRAGQLHDVARHQRGVWRFLRVLGCAGLQAEAIAIDAMVIALQRGVGERDERAAASFLRRTARHLWLREQRAERRRARHHAEAAERWWARSLARDDGDAWLDALDRCREQLPPRSQQALERTYRDGFGRADLAAELGIGEHGVRNLLARLRAALRDCMQRRLER